MDLQSVIECLEIKERREEFIARLKNAGENSNPVLQVQNAMTELKMHKAPKGIFEKTMLQNIFQNFCEPDECFQSFRLVCKSWKNAVETIRFDQELGTEFFYKLNRKLTNDNTLVSNVYFEKYLPAFKRLCIQTNLSNKTLIYPLILTNTKKLNQIHFFCLNTALTQEDESFIFQMLQISQKTLHTLNLPKFIGLEMNFPNLTKLTLQIRSNNFLAAKFQECFPQTLDKMKNLDCVALKVGDWDNLEPICQYIRKNYSKHCISADYMDESFDQLLDYIPIPIVENISLEQLQNTKHMSEIIYAGIFLFWEEESTWGRYQEIFDQCTNLKAIEFSENSDGQHFIPELVPTLSETEQEQWNERISYFRKRNIRLTNANEILENENLKKNLAKEAGISWRFHFYS